MGALKRAVQHGAQYAPGVWNWRTSTLITQRLRGGIHDEEFRGLEFDSHSKLRVFDVGANVGQSVMTLKQLAPRAQITCFEPTPFALRPLLRLAAHYHDVTVVPAACGSTSGRLATIFVPEAKGVVFSQMASLKGIAIPEMVEFLKGAGFTWVDCANLSVVPYPVVTIALDDVGAVPDLIKIDAEGFEVEVLKGAARLLKENAPTLIIETNQIGHEIREFLTPFGYEAKEARVNTIFTKRFASSR